jgi:hypothetical protein
MNETNIQLAMVLTVVSGMERSGFPETIVHYFCGNMKGAAFKFVNFLIALNSLIS